MWVHDELEHAEVGHVYRAFALATHAGDWSRTGEYGLNLLKAFPDILTTKVGGIKPLLEDRDIWPGVAAMIVHRWHDMSRELRCVLENPPPEHAGAVSSIREMTAGVKAEDPYLSVLAMEKRR
jgi:hypothetical protein